MAKKPSPLDLRQHTINSMADFKALVDPATKTVILSPEQIIALQTEAFKLRPDLIGQPVTDIGGYGVETKGRE